MDKRNFLKLAGAALVISSYRIFSPAVEETLATLIRNELDYLKLDDAGLARFVKDYSQYVGKVSRVILKGFSFAQVDASASGRIHHLVSSYLLSTDFFLNKMDEARTLQYLGLHNPHTRPFLNPFLQAFYPDNPG